LAIGYLVIAFGVKGLDPSTKVSMVWLVSLYTIHTFGELCLSPIGLSMVNKLAPVKLASLLMGVWFLSTAAANKFAGTLADIGGFSLNYHKFIHTGEGGVLVTNNYVLSEKMKMIRNHAESILKERKNFPLQNMIGYNFRMGEIEAAIGIQQLKKLNKILKNNQLVVKKIINNLKNLNGLIFPKTPNYTTNVFYVLPIIYSEKLTGVDIKKIVFLLKKSGVPIEQKYQNLHLLPLFQKKIAYGKNHFPWSYYKSRKNVSYKKGICPNAEAFNNGSFLLIPVTSYNFSSADIEFITKKFKYVWNRCNINKN
jgi:dTDP-4-amino-4,6-dideoxygalactose transaminase